MKELLKVLALVAVFGVAGVACTTTEAPAEEAFSNVSMAIFVEADELTNPGEEIGVRINFYNDAAGANLVYDTGAQVTYNGGDVIINAGGWLLQDNQLGQAYELAPTGVGVTDVIRANFTVPRPANDGTTANNNSVAFNAFTDILFAEVEVFTDDPGNPDGDPLDGTNDILEANSNIVAITVAGGDANIVNVPLNFNIGADTDFGTLTVEAADSTTFYVGGTISYGTAVVDTALFGQVIDTANCDGGDGAGGDGLTDFTIEVYDITAANPGTLLGTIDGDEATGEFYSQIVGPTTLTTIALDVNINLTNNCNAGNADDDPVYTIPVANTTYFLEGLTPVADGETYSFDLISD